MISTEQTFSFHSVWLWKPLNTGCTVYQSGFMVDTDQPCWKLSDTLQIWFAKLLLHDKKPQHLSFPGYISTTARTISIWTEVTHTDTSVLYHDKAHALHVRCTSTWFLCLILHPIAFLCFLQRLFTSRYTCLYACTSHQISLMLLTGLWWRLVWKIQ